MDANACLKSPFSWRSLSVVLGLMLVVLSESCALHVVLMDNTFKGEERLVQDSVDKAVPHGSSGSGCRKIDKTSVAWLASSSQASGGIALGSFGCQDPMDKAVPHGSSGSGCRKIDKTSVAWLASSSQASGGIALGSFGGSDCMGGKSVMQEPISFTHKQF
jgi:hypothetical protein